jgi:opacity protein-like surface antigen
MKPLLTLSLVTTLLYNNVAHSFVPEGGVYLGLMGGVSHASSVDINFLDPFPINFQDRGRLTYDIGGNGGGQLGYRFSNWRMELEAKYNVNKYDRLQGRFIQFESRRTSTRASFEGQTNVFSLFLNGYYDFFFEDPDFYVVPYVGLGVGYARVQNRIDFFLGNRSCPIFGFCDDASRRFTDNRVAVQGILGLSYYVDDYWAIGLDYRYIGIGNVSRNSNNTTDNNSRLHLNTLNLNFNYFFGC